MTNTDYIEREKFTKALKIWRDNLIENYGKNDEYVKCLDSVLLGLYSTPVSDVRPVVRGDWVEMFSIDEYPLRNHWVCCSICGHIAPFGKMSDKELRTNFCPNCGADMRGKHETK